MLDSFVLVFLLGAGARKGARPCQFLWHSHGTLSANAGRVDIENINIQNVYIRASITMVMLSASRGRWSEGQGVPPAVSRDGEDARAASPLHQRCAIFENAPHSQFTPFCGLPLHPRPCEPHSRLNTGVNGPVYRVCDVQRAHISLPVRSIAHVESRTFSSSPYTPVASFPWPSSCADICDCIPVVELLARSPPLCCKTKSFASELFLDKNRSSQRPLPFRPIYDVSIPHLYTTVNKRSPKEWTTRDCHGRGVAIEPPSVPVFHLWHVQRPSTHPSVDAASHHNVGQ